MSFPKDTAKIRQTFSFFQIFSPNFLQISLFATLPEHPPSITTPHNCTIAKLHIPVASLYCQPSFRAICPLLDVVHYPACHAGLHCCFVHYVRIIFAQRLPRAAHIVHFSRMFARGICCEIVPFALIFKRRISREYFASRSHFCDRWIKVSCARHFRYRVILSILPACHAGSHHPFFVYCVQILSEQRLFWAANFSQFPPHFPLPIPHLVKFFTFLFLFCINLHLPLALFIFFSYLCMQNINATAYLMAV